MGYQHRPEDREPIVTARYLVMVILILIAFFLLLQATDYKFKMTGQVYQRPDVDVNVLNLKNFPIKFFQDGIFKTTAVYDLGALPALLKIENTFVERAAECTKEFSAEKTEEVSMIQTLANKFGTSLSSSLLDGFMRGVIDVDISDVAKDYAVHDELRFVDDSKLAPHTTLTFGNNDRFKDLVFIPMPKNSIGYYLVFDTPLVSGNRLTDASATYPIDLTFLGKELRIDSATATSITVNVGQKFQLNAGDSVTVEGKEVRLAQTSGTKAKIMVDGLIDVVEQNSNARINGLEIRVEDVSDDEGIEYDSATLFVGGQARKTFKDGTEFIGESTDEPLWEWNLENLNSANPTFGFRLAQEIDDPSESHPLIQHPLYEGEQICLPYDYACIEFQELTIDDYKAYEIQTQNKELFDSVASAENGSVEVSTSVLVFRTNSGKGFRASGDNSEEIYMYSTGTALRLYRQLPGSSKAVYFANAGSNAFNLEYKDTSIPVTVNWNSGTDAGSIVLDLNSDLTINFQADQTDTTKINYLGSAQGSTNISADIRVGSTDITSYDSDVRLREGIVIEDPESHSRSDDFKMAVPSDINDFKVMVGIKTQGKKNSECEVTSVQLTRSRMLTKDPKLIILGTASTADSYLSNALLEQYNQNDAIVTMVEKDGVIALLILGHTQSDIYTAAEAIADYKQHDLNTDVMIF